MYSFNNIYVIYIAFHVLIGSWLRPGSNIDYLDEDTGKWWEGNVKKMDVTVDDPIIVVSFLGCDKAEEYSLSQSKQLLLHGTHHAATCVNVVINAILCMYTIYQPLCISVYCNLLI